MYYAVSVNGTDPMGDSPTFISLSDAMKKKLDISACDCQAKKTYTIYVTDNSSDSTLKDKLEEGIQKAWVETNQGQRVQGRID